MPSIESSEFAGGRVKPRWRGLHVWIVLLALLILALLLGISTPAARIFPFIGKSATQNTLETALAGSATLRPAGYGVDRVVLRAFYAAQAYQPVWTGSEDAGTRAQTALNALGGAGDEGLDAANYRVGALVALQLGASLRERTDFELLLTDALLRYARDVRLGRVTPASVDPDVGLPAQTFDASAALESALVQDRFDGFVVDLPPPHPEYARLKLALRRYRAIAEAGGWPLLQSALDVKSGGESPSFDILRRRLAAEDDQLAPVRPADGNLDLLPALIRYQSRNGLAPDGILGPKTLTMLNMTAAGRAAQIAANMERWRWLPRTLEPGHLRVNAADASVEAVKDGTVLIRSKVVVGEPDKRTPMLRTVAREITVNPPWNVPTSIAANEILPRLRRDPTYLRSQNIVLLNGPASDPHGLEIDWRMVSPSAFPFLLQQSPGPDNPLGFLKFEMPNGYSVFLHDTPGKAAFERESRTLSHGCIRVEQILALASFALSGDPASAVGELSEAIATGETRSIPLPRPLPVYLLYWTALAREDGEVEFRPDVYGRDGRLIAALSGGGFPGPSAALAVGCSATG